MSVTFLIGTFITCIVRWTVFLTCWCIGYDFWILPNLFDESLTVVESFKPLYTFEKTPKGQGIYRAVLAVLLVAFVVWCYNQPTEGCRSDRCKLRRTHVMRTNRHRNHHGPASSTTTM